mgnify:FL=1|jgi:Transcriptional regulators
MNRQDAANSWQEIQQEVLRRIRSREWAPGDLIPHEAVLAAEFGCARTTVNRALREIAETGLIERRRRAGTRVALHPVRRATLEIPVIRLDIERRGQRYGYELLTREEAVPPREIGVHFHEPDARPLLHLVCLHRAGGSPHVIEDRWIDTAAIPEAHDEDFTSISPNEWLVLKVPFEGGDITFSATQATPGETALLGCEPGAALFVVERMTWTGSRTLTRVRLTFAPGHRVTMSL